MVKERKLLDIFLETDAKPEEHLAALKQHYFDYWATLLLLTSSDTHLTEKMRVAVLYSVMAKRDREAFDYLMDKPFYGILDLRDAIKLLMELRKEKNLPGYSSSTRKMVIRWFKSLGEDQLVDSLKGAYVPWLEVIDLTHSKPGDFQVPWFQGAVFGGKVPEESRLGKLRKFKTVSKDEQKQIIQQEGIHGYHYLKQKMGDDKELKLAEARTMKISQLIRFHGRFLEAEAAEILLERLRETRSVHMNFAELLSHYDTITRKGYFEESIRGTMEGIVGELRRLADASLEKQRINLDYPVAVLVDISSSMYAAIKLGVPIAAIFAYQEPDETMLVFFHDHAFTRPPPGDLESALSMINTVHPRGCTSPAAALSLIDGNGFKPRTVIVITDEGENTSVYHDGADVMFADLYKHLYGLDYPRLVMISLGADHTMADALEGHGIPFESFRLKETQEDFSFIESLFAIVRHSKDVVQAIHQKMVSHHLSRKYRDTQDGEPRMDIGNVEKALKKQGASMFSLGEELTTLSDLVLLGWESRKEYLVRLEEIKVLADTLNLPAIAGEAESQSANLAPLPVIGDDQREQLLVLLTGWRVRIKNE